MLFAAIVTSGLPDARIVLLDFITGGDLESFSWGAAGRGTSPFIRAYVISESDFVRKP